VGGGDGIASKPAGAARAQQIGLILELVVLYLLIPAYFLAEDGRVERTVVILAGLAYVIVQSRRLRILRRSSLGLARFSRWNGVLGVFGAFALSSTIAVATFAPELLFRAPRYHPRLWVTFLAVYCLLSVYPQALVFRAYFLERYAPLFPNASLLVAVNSVLFAWAHTIIDHPLVYALAFCGGILFAVTYLESRSITVTSLEHALYGAWLFTVGLGTYFAFPV